MSVIFNTESRLDLAESIRTDYTCEFLYPIVLPIVNVYEEAGRIAVAQSITTSADTNRAFDAALTNNHLASLPIDYATSAYESRIVVSDSDLKNMGDDLTVIQSEMANAGAGASVGKMETAAEAALYAGANWSVTATSAAPFAAIAEAAYKVAPYGEPTLVCSQYWLSQMLQYDAFTKPVLRLFGEGAITGIISGADAVLKAVAGWMGLPGGIKVGKDDAGWKNASHSGNAFIVGLRPEMRDPSRAFWTCKARPTLGATLTFLPRDREGTPWYCDTGYLSSNKLNYVDVGIKAIPKIFNGKGAAKIALPA